MRAQRFADQRLQSTTTAIAAVDEVLTRSAKVLPSEDGAGKRIMLLEEELRCVRQRLVLHQRSSEAEIARIKGIAEAYKYLLQKHGALVDIYPSNRTRGHRAQATSAALVRHRCEFEDARRPPQTPPPPASLASAREVAPSPLWRDVVHVEGQGWVPRAFAPFPEPQWQGSESPPAGCEPSPTASSAASSHALLHFRDYFDRYGREATRAKYPEMYEHMCVDGLWRPLCGDEDEPEPSEQPGTPRTPAREACRIERGT